jgi:hypothetical protein
MIEKINGDYSEAGEAEKTKKIMRLNDSFRQTLHGGLVILTRGVQALGEDMVERILLAVRSFNKFEPGNDPYGEHDFEAVTVDGVKYFWKIDYFDNALSLHSPDASDPAVTARVMTIMKAEEY